jgi:hypothetical protein
MGSDQYTGLILPRSIAFIAWCLESDVTSLLVKSESLHWPRGTANCPIRGEGHKRIT